MTNTKAAIFEFVAALNAKFGSDYLFQVDMGRKNARVYTVDPRSSYPQRSAYCFVRIEDGAILKVATWKAPAQGVRAWLSDVLASNLEGVDQYTSWLYR